MILAMLNLHDIDKKKILNRYFESKKKNLCAVFDLFFFYIRKREKLRDT